MHFPIIPVIDIGERGRDAAFGHHRVRLAEQAFANHANGNASSGSFNCRAQSGAAAANNENVVLKSFVVGHRLHNSPIVPDPHRAQTHVKIGETDPEQAQPCPKHVATI